jgi:hypothetical protein
MMNQDDTYKHPEFPFIPEALVLTLDQTFPLTSPSLDDSERQIFLKAGQRQVVEFLKLRLAEQEEAGRFGFSRA